MLAGSLECVAASGFGLGFNFNYITTNVKHLQQNLCYPYNTLNFVYDDKAPVVNGTLELQRINNLFEQAADI